ncbi:MAG: copper resistance protein NlpE [Bacteroidales bacterium]|jgi:uncharacterized lipoprotein NlpE involved in copper resistance|nr:copper resistance protein NlpE [Bacteroidales bacterium]
MKEKMMCMVGVMIVTITLYSCQNKPTEQQSCTSATEAVENLPAWAGTYEGTLPCADCQGIETRLKLNADGSYAMLQHYIDKEGDFLSEGNIEWEPDKNIFMLQNTADKSTVYFLAGENTMTWLDQNRQIIDGTFAEQYVLKKTNK